jgi:hypothetical protein
MAKGANKKYIIKLTPEERAELQPYARGFKVAAQKKQRARILLMTDQGEAGEHQPDTTIAQTVAVSQSTVERIREYACEVGPLAALTARTPNRIYERKLDGAAEARLVKIACSTPPEGADRWSTRLLKDELIHLQIVDTIGDETVRKTLKKTSLSLI